MFGVVVAEEDVEVTFGFEGLGDFCAESRLEGFSLVSDGSVGGVGLIFSRGTYFVEDI